MRAVVVEAPGMVAVREVAPPDKAGRALIRVLRAGICGTDLKVISGATPVRYPRVIGHEMVGVVEEPGPTGAVAVGRRVLIDPGVACGRCPICRRDLDNLCPHGGLRGRDEDGGFAELVAVDEDRLHPLPDSLGNQDTALLQVLATCVRAQTRVPIFPGQVATVLGLGVSGLLHVQLLRERGLRTIVAVGRTAWKHDLARELGASHAVAPDDAAALLADLTEGLGADLTVDTAGQPSTLRQAIGLAAPGATVLAFGIVAGDVQLQPYDWYLKELTIIGSRHARPRDYAATVALAATGTLRLGQLVTRTFPLSEATAAIAAAQDDRQLKVVLNLAG